MFQRRSRPNVPLISTEDNSNSVMDYNRMNQVRAHDSNEDNSFDMDKISSHDKISSLSPMRGRRHRRRSRLAVKLEDDGEEEEERGGEDEHSGSINSKRSPALFQYFKRSKQFQPSSPVHTHISSCGDDSLLISPTLVNEFFVENQYAGSLFAEQHDDTAASYCQISEISDGFCEIDQQKIIRPNQSHLNVSYAFAQNNRPYMEDRFSIIRLKVRNEDSLFSTKNILNSEAYDHCKLSCYSVFDGHGGSAASQFANDYLYQIIQNQIVFPENLEQVLPLAFRDLDDNFKLLWERASKDNKNKCVGTTACTCIIQGRDRIVCGNVGDSRAIVVRRDGSFYQLTKEHKPGRADETKRITDLGGKVLYVGQWRVQGMLAVSRAIGDIPLKPYISSEPHIVDYTIQRGDVFLIIASDGLWDVMDNDAVSNFVCTHGQQFVSGMITSVDGDEMKLLSQKLVDQAKACGTMDNISVIAIDITNA